MRTQPAGRVPYERWAASLLIASLLLVPSASPALADYCRRWIDGPLQQSANGADGPIYSTTLWDPDGAGPQPLKVVVGGAFTRIGGAKASRLAIWDGVVWREFGGGFDGDVRAVISFDGMLVVAGAFHNAAGLLTTYVVGWNGFYWRAMGNGLSGGSSVYALAVWNGNLYAGGDFTQFMRRWDPATFSWVNLPETVDGTVYTLADYGGYLHAGGAFMNISTMNALHVARWNGSSWFTVASGTNGNVYAMTVFNGELIVGGAFTQTGFQLRYYCVRWDGTAWADMNPLNSDTHGTVYCLSAIGGSLYAGGAFSGAGSGYDAKRIARWTGSDWAAIGPGVGTADGEEAVRAITSYNGNLVAAGRFTTAATVPEHNITQWNGQYWGETTSPVSARAVTTYGSRIAIGGSFVQSFPSVDSYHVVAWDGADLIGLGGGMNAPVNALTGYTDPAYPNDNHLVGGGEFTWAGGVPANRVALWTESNSGAGIGWSALGPGFDDLVFALARFAGKTVAGGTFTHSGANVRNRIARWDGAAWQSMGTGMNGPILALKSYSVNISTSVLVAGGTFTTANGSTANSIATWISNTLTGETPWMALGAGLNGPVYAIERYGNTIYAAGTFTASGSTPLNYVAKYVSGTGWVDVGQGRFAGGVYALKADGAYLYAGDDFNRVSRWDGSSWTNPDGGTFLKTRALAAYHGDIIAGGSFASTGLISFQGTTRYLATGKPWIANQPDSQSVAEGQTASFTTQAATGYEGLTYQWRRQGVSLSDGPTGHGSTLSGTTASTLQIVQTAIADSGLYDCMATFPFCDSVASLVATLTVTPTAGVGEAGGPARLELAARPNPFQHATSVEFTLARSGFIRALVYDVSGRLVRHLLEGSKAAGLVSIPWNGRDDAGGLLPAGIYLVQVRGAGANASRRVVLVK